MDNNAMLLYAFELRNASMGYLEMHDDRKT